MRNTSPANENDKNERFYTVGKLRLNPHSREVWVGEVPIDLTKKEFDLLAYLIQHKGQVLSREQLLDSVWGYDYIGKTNTIDVYIRYLRVKIEEPFGEKFIQTVRGVGYIIRE